MGSYFLLTFAVQLWITHVVYKFWRLLSCVEPDRLRVIADAREADMRRAQLVVF